ncbi:hypothetical protein CKY47_35095 [Saccharothrix yanglingensis]|uniref:Uncharacterized protein n=1 Tax=Saccharothrix yanglingensis TaxID=659496 RepID=A0ABU0XAL2_9PSEU|nr:hypothetical protein [Saccharothrix yanglingensis]
MLGTSFAVIAFAKWQLEDEPSADADRLLAPVVDSGDVDWTRLHRPGAFTTPDLGALAARTGPGEESLREFFPRGRRSR